MTAYYESLHAPLRRVWWIIGMLLVLVLIGTLAIGPLFGHQQPAGSSLTWLCQHATETTNPVQAENTCPGTDRWREDHLPGPEQAIEGFTDPVSAQAGENIKLYVSTTAPIYSFEVYRLGWYQGLGGRLVYTSAVLPGINQPAPVIDPTTHMVSCTNWRTPVTLTLPRTWVSGVYLIKLLAGKYMRYTSFVLRNDASHAAILFQTSVLTYQAYNSWGGYSLYGGPGSDEVASSQDRAYVVSFDRPYDRGDGLGNFPIYDEHNLLRWLERFGYDVSYSTDVDTDQRPATLLQHRLLLVAGHDEYWSTAMRTNVTAARDAGVSLAFFGGNDLYWHVRLQSSPLGLDREVVCYKPGYYNDRIVDPFASSHPDEATVLWRNPPLNRPENELLGEMYAGQVLTPAPLVITQAASPFYTNTTLRAGSSLNGLIGGEYDQAVYNRWTPSTLTILAASPLHCVRTHLCPKNGLDTADATLYTATSGARVFDAGTFYWGGGLDDDSLLSRTQTTSRHYATAAFGQFTANLLAYLMR